MRRLALPSSPVLLASFVAAASIYIFLLNPWGHDTWYHLLRLLDVEAQLGRGQWPHFGENVAQGKGLPVWVYYSQWIYWPAILLTSQGVTPLIALKIVYCAFLVLCCAGCYRLLRLYADAPLAAFGTLAFLTSNFVIGEIFTRSAYSEFVSVAVLPLLLFAMHRTVLHRDRGAASILVVTAAWMILAHPLSFMNAAWAIAAYAVWLVTAWRAPVRSFAGVAALFALAFALTAFFWLPAVVETRDVLGAEGVPTKIQETFLTIFKYLNFSSVNNIGFVLDVLGAIVVASLLLRRLRRADRPAERRPAWPLLAGIAVYVLLTLRISAPLYELSFFASNLWVFRVLFPLALLVVILIVDNLDAAPAAVRNEASVRAIGLLAVLQAAIFVGWYTHEDVSLSVLDRAETELGLYPDTVSLNGFGISEYQPNPRVLPRVLQGCRTVRTVTPPWDRNRATFTVEAADAASCIQIPRYWNFRYEASIGGTPTTVYADANSEVLLATGGLSGEAVLQTARPRYVLVSAAVSAAAAFLALIGALWSLAPTAKSAWTALASPGSWRFRPASGKSFARPRRRRLRLALLLALLLVAWWWLSRGEEIVPALSAVLL